MADKSTVPSAVSDALINHLSPQRLAPYLYECHNDINRAVSLYLLDREVAVALFRDISVIEVALRNALDRALVNKYGEYWHRQAATIFDRRTFDQIAEAWDSLPKQRRSHDPDNHKIRGRLIAACTFGTWVAMLDNGGSTACKAPSNKASHDDVWDLQTLLTAFKGGQLISKSEDKAQFTRDWVYQQIRPIHLTRNRIAHHESLIKGIPIPGTGNSDREVKRIQLNEAHQKCMRVAAMIDQDLHTFLEGTSTAKQAIDRVEALRQSVC
ncbi:Abi family protein [Corynebacterium sp. TAE3-ERU12]|uniref:Abi family protein n=1 Tax=Corynebacterium sp. TAE3-ERU12 TaxID=2849491 RepID=UPI001C495563|nr:Abi family protein [Corynebacterium sp. TAE3-ERU12]MBV7294352.1 Abi family protein [Corynebacterium sp. TAE3-ERU12]